MGEIAYENLIFAEYEGGFLPDYFEYEEKDCDLVDFYNEDAKSLQESSMAKVINVFLQDKLVAYFGYLPASLAFSQIQPSDKQAKLAHPVLKLGRLLVCRSQRGKGIGTHIITKVASIALEARKIMPLRFITLDSIPHSIGFYKKLGFIDSNISPRPDGSKLMYIDINRLV